MLPFHLNFDFLVSSFVVFCCCVFSQDPDSDNGDSLEVIHLSKKVKSSKHKRKKKIVSVASISEPMIEDFHGEYEGPIIEIPPIDDIKLASAIKNNQNNNEELENDRSETPGHRVPGDGIEGVTNKNHSPGRANSAMYVSDDIEITPDKSKGDNNDNATINENGDIAVEKSVFDDNDTVVKDRVSDKVVDDINSSQSFNLANSGSKSPSVAKTNSTFLDQIEARVSNLVKSGEKMEQEELLEDAQNNATNESDKYFRYSENNYGIVNEHRELYEDEVVKDEIANKIVPKNVSNESVQNSAIEEVSIYSKVINSDSSDNEETDSLTAPLRQNLSRASIQSNISSQSQRSEISTLSTNFSQDLRSTPGFVKENRSCSIASACYESDSPFYGLSSNRNTPNLPTANQGRSSVLSNQSGNEVVSDIASRSESKISSNGITGFRESPLDNEGRSSQMSGSSTQSAGQESEGNSIYVFDLKTHCRRLLVTNLVYSQHSK